MKKKTRKVRGKADKSGTVIYKGKPVAITKDGIPYRHDYFCKNSKIEKVLRHLESGKTLSQLQCYPPSKFNTIRLGALIKELRDRGYEITTEMKYNKTTGSRHGVYSMEV